MDVVILPRKIFKSINYSKKWSTQRQSYFLERLSELLAEGFSLGEALSFLQIMMSKEVNDIQKILNQMEEGRPFPETLAQLGFPEQIIVQLNLSLLHANFIETMKLCSIYITEKQKQLLNLKKAAIYPCFLLFFSFFMLLAIRGFLLPTLESSLSTGSDDENHLIRALLFFLEYMPQILFGFISSILLGVFVFKKILANKSTLDKATIYSKIPIFGKWFIDYYTAFFSREFSYFFLNGQSIYKIVETFKSDSSSTLMQQIAFVMENNLKKGDNLKDIINQFPFFRTELGWIIYQGELTSQVGLKLKIYSQECHRSLTQDIEKKINMLQPVLFLLIGFIIVFVYAILMLPMLSMMGGGI